MPTRAVQRDAWHQLYWLLTVPNTQDIGNAS